MWEHFLQFRVNYFNLSGTFNIYNIIHGIKIFNGYEKKSFRKLVFLDIPCKTDNIHRFLWFDPIIIIKCACNSNENGKFRTFFAGKTSIFLP